MPNHTRRHRLVLAPLATGLLLLLNGCQSNPSRPAETAVNTGGAVNRQVLDTRYVPDQRPAELQPTRVPPTTMAAWIAPWENATGDVFPGSVVYIEVQPEQWAYGTGGVATVLRPMQVEQRPAPPAGAPTNAAEVAPAGLFPGMESGATATPRWGA